MADDPIANAVSNHDGTEYVVLKKNETTNESERGWAEVKKVTVTAGAEAAVRAVVGTPTAAKNGVYLAIPTRSWKPIIVAVETKTVLKLTEA